MNERYVVTYLDENNNKKNIKFIGSWQDLRDFISQNNYTLVGWDFD